MIGVRTRETSRGGEELCVAMRIVLVLVFDDVAGAR
jgi:hypothetical protein